MVLPGRSPRGMVTPRSGPSGLDGDRIRLTGSPATFLSRLFAFEFFQELLRGRNARLRGGGVGGRGEEAREFACGGRLPVAAHPVIERLLRPELLLAFPAAFGEIKKLHLAEAAGEKHGAERGGGGRRAFHQRLVGVVVRRGLAADPQVAPPDRERTPLKSNHSHISQS